MNQTDINTYIKLLEQFAVNFVTALIILCIGWILSNFVSRLIHRVIVRTGRIDQTVIPMLSSAARWVVRILTCVIVLSQFGVQTASLIAALSAAGLAIGLALQGTLQNIAAGIMLLCLRPISVGESVAIGGSVSGTVSEIGLFLTRVLQADGVAVTMPNSVVWGATITNFSRNGRRRMDIPVALRYGEDIEKAMQVLVQMASAQPRVSSETKPSVFVSQYCESSVLLTLRVWTSTADFSDVQSVLMLNVRQCMEQNGFKQPIPVLEQINVKA